MDKKLCACPLFPCVKCRMELKSKQAFMRQLLSKSDEKHAFDNQLETNWSQSQQYWTRQEKAYSTSPSTKPLTTKYQKHEMSPNRI
jgi:hypothetical protein